MKAFTVRDASTWSEVMTVHEIAAIYRRKVGGLRKSCQRGQFAPAPYREHPWLWRKVDVERDVFGPRIQLRRIAS